jgi:hydrogenase expression/formation protein HypD
MVHGPGCPVCVTAQMDIDRAVKIAGLKNVILTTFGDMLRVPGSDGSLSTAKAKGADVRMVYSTLDAIQRDLYKRALEMRHGPGWRLVGAWLRRQ